MLLGFVIPPLSWSARRTYYLASALTKQIASGESYADIKPVIGIHLLDFDLFTEPHQLSQAHWCFEMRDRWQPATKLGSELELNIIDTEVKPTGCTASFRKAWLPGSPFLNTGARSPL